MIVKQTGNFIVNNILIKPIEIEKNYISLQIKILLLFVNIKNFREIPDLVIRICENRLANVMLNK